MNGILRSGRALAGLTAVVMVLEGCGDAADRSAPDPPSSTRPVPEPAPAAADAAVRATEYPVPGGSHPHDVAPAADGSVWYTAQAHRAAGAPGPGDRADRDRRSKRDWMLARLHLGRCLMRFTAFDQRRLGAHAPETPYDRLAARGGRPRGGRRALVRQVTGHAREKDLAVSERTVRGVFGRPTSNAARSRSGWCESADAPMLRQLWLSLEESVELAGDEGPGSPACCGPPRPTLIPLRYSSRPPQQ
jgi:hypothetical protein